MKIRELKRTLLLAKKNDEKEFIAQFRNEIVNALDLIPPRKRRAILALLEKA